MDEHIDITGLALSRRVKSTIPSRIATCRSFSFTLAFNIKVIKPLISHHAYVSPVYINLQTSIELLSVITQNKEKDVSFSREEDEKLEVCQFIYNVSY